MMLAAALASLAIVAQDHAALRLTARDSAPQEAVLLQGEVLEVRGQHMEYLQVYDHRLERAGYVRASQVRSLDTTAESAPALLTVTRFLRDTPGAEALGIGYAAAYLKAAPASAIDAEPFDAIGTMSERLAWRASQHESHASDTQTADRLQVLSTYGVTMRTIERAGETELCYDGDAFKRVLALPATPLARARAALALTRHDCVDPSLTPTDRYTFDQWRADVLDHIPLTDLPEYVKARVHMRRAGVYASLAFQAARRGDAAHDAGERALAELAAVTKNDLTESDQATYADAAVRVGASRWAGQDSVARPATLAIATVAGDPGQTCVILKPVPDPKNTVLARRCTFGIVWTASAAPAFEGRGLALAVQMSDTWRELWLFHPSEGGWLVEVVPPSSAGPDLGYLEFAGWIPGGDEVLVAREALVNGHYRRTFEVMRVATQEIEHSADSAAILTSFQRWQDRAWKHQSIALR